MTTTHSPIGATALGFPRIGRNRELKLALDAYWAGRIDAAALEAAATAVRLDAVDSMTGLDSVPVNTFSWYDQVLDTVVLVGAVPERYRAISGEHVLAGFDAARYFAMARGNAEVAPLEMTKWFDTNYHYLVPEIGPETAFTLNAAKPLAELAEATARGVRARPVIVGPFTFLALAKASDEAPEGYDPLERLDDLVEVYARLLGELAVAGAEWVQLDETAAVRDLSPTQAEQLGAVYRQLAAITERPAILVTTSFADPVEGLPALVASGVESVSLDILRGPSLEAAREVPGIDRVELVLGAVDGHNIWRADLTATLARLRDWDGVGAARSVGTTCSLLHVPYDSERETSLPEALRANLAFADQKLAEVVALQHALDGRTDQSAAAFAASDVALAERDAIPGRVNADIAARLAGLSDADRTREHRPERAVAQTARLELPLLPTTTIGSFPQTQRLRSARAAVRAGRLDEAAYEGQMREEVREVIALQTEIGLDVLVHGEPERNDMVQYFAEQLEGYAATVHGWVQSYGSRCVRPPILFGDVHRPRPMTVEWAAFAQSLTPKPVKGMLTGPVTMLAWSFVREDQPRSVTADQVALALRDEVSDLEAAGIGIVQVDEPALRETLPLRAAGQAAYLDWAVAAFRLATSSVRAETQVHTHLCYSEFGEIIGAIDALDADVTSIEAARSRMELLADIQERGFGGALGPGVYDIHSPRVPRTDEVEELLRAALASLPAGRLWVNPDCGLKTRGYAEVEPALRNLVDAAARVRATAG
ncbi:MAG: 5-methyltetrahydropteroyltriglutamate--homocysteine S-methyltransferase [Tessaracoccus sp.]|uniref:5-methyltetrahydropteroyltriglutamate-- homocysteine S-methyltransferase n=1 Tax=Tessaracoccus sp. TaxID=1971211 RepID=UPI001ECD3E79|nr:5-methyltetrahydropteroyltriglutamate--homocysteine S-methyltransferase [Tessaracoccus sp.]MBK7821754.1 5-methyltetrahydropteroyltriglutamate--homocysteine S-methyltransferase [Tessaracoccus sp.]